MNATNFTFTLGRKAESHPHGGTAGGRWVDGRHYFWICCNISGGFNL